jgi:hypothetical protein
VTLSLPVPVEQWLPHRGAEMSSVQFERTSSSPFPFFRLGVHSFIRRNAALQTSNKKAD